MKTKHGKPIFDDRVAAYLATLISAHYRDTIYKERMEAPDHSQILEELIGTFTNLESALKGKLPEFKKTNI
jgi:hypothetical protein